MRDGAERGPEGPLPPVARRLERAFDVVARTRMRDVPILNPALRVEAIGFRRWSGRWIGVLVTPWFMNLVLLPDESAPRAAPGRSGGPASAAPPASPPAPVAAIARVNAPFVPPAAADPATEIWNPVPLRESRRYALPAGMFEFIGGHEDDVGEFQSCSLFSPMAEFATHEAARATALAALDALFDAGTVTARDPLDPPLSPEPTSLSAASGAAPDEPAVQPSTGPAAVPATHLPVSAAPVPSRRRFLGGS